MTSAITTTINSSGYLNVAFRENSGGDIFAIINDLANGFVAAHTAERLLKLYKRRNINIQGLEAIHGLFRINHPDKDDILNDLMDILEKCGYETLMEMYQEQKLYLYVESELEDIDPSTNWIEYITSSALRPINQVEISSTEVIGFFESSKTDSADLEEQLLNRCAPHLLTRFKNTPEKSSFRVFEASNFRSSKFGDYDHGIHTYGVDLNIAEGWKGIWTAQGGIYRSLFDIKFNHEDLYLLIYVDDSDKELLHGPGFLDEGALSFLRLAAEGKTLRDLLSNGVLIKIKRKYADKEA